MNAEYVQHATRRLYSNMHLYNSSHTRRWWEGAVCVGWAVRRGCRSGREGGFEALRRVDGLGTGAVGLEGGGTRGNEKVQQQQQTKHCRRWREGP